MGYDLSLLAKDREGAVTNLKLMRNPIVISDQRDKFTYADKNMIRIIDHIVSLTDLKPGWCHGHEIPPSKQTAAFAVHTLRIIPDRFSMYATPGDNDVINISAMLNTFCVELEVTFGKILSIGIEKGIGNVYDELGHLDAPTHEQIVAVFALIAAVVDTKNYDNERIEKELKTIFSSVTR